MKLINHLFHNGTTGDDRLVILCQLRADLQIG